MFCVTKRIFVMPPLYLLLTLIGVLLVVILLVTLAVSIVRMVRGKRSGIDARSTALMPTVQPEGARKGSSPTRIVIAVVLMLGVLLYSGWQIFLYVQGSSQTHTIAIDSTPTPSL